jgi:uncharacterized protein (TIGR02271 family)
MAHEPNQPHAVSVQRDPGLREVTPYAMSSDDARADGDANSVIRHEEELLIGKQPVEVGHVRVQTHVDETPVNERVETQAEHLDRVEHVPATDRDSGEIETLPDGSVSIPVLEEQLVITKRLVVRERVIIRKRTIIEDRSVEATLRKERVTVDGDIEPTIDEMNRSDSG